MERDGAVDEVKFVVKEALERNGTLDEVCRIRVHSTCTYIEFMSCTNLFDSCEHESGRRCFTP